MLIDKQWVLLCCCYSSMLVIVRLPERHWNPTKNVSWNMHGFQVVLSSWTSLSDGCIRFWTHVDLATLPL